jgi:hypothetical protein
MRTRKRDIARAEELILPVTATLKLLNELLEEEQTLPRVSSLGATPRSPRPPQEPLWAPSSALHAPPNATPSFCDGCERNLPILLGGKRCVPHQEGLPRGWITP